MLVWKNEKDCRRLLSSYRKTEGPKSIIPIGYNKDNQVAYELSNKRDLRT